ncbi:TatD family hydrolase [Peribacillus alkalitolerans]|uniref:TatD family hydrolase n=1 Tax=Peribacillus alkalitolerans TaxID=1550385 RepID=UPI0013D26EFF|nr:TatD family hydrolase [Peribacillus alkalitolerans]
MRLIDSHIHFDKYDRVQQNLILSGLEHSGVDALISVSMDLASCERNKALSKVDSRIKAAFGFHPEQDLLTEKEIEKLFKWMEQHQSEMVAVGEVGLPYYRRLEGRPVDMPKYIELLEHFIIFAKKTDKPVILHAVYEDAPVVCGLLEKHSITKAHFHWFKGDSKTIERMINNGFHVSITPDVCYEKEIQDLVCRYPIELLMIETDGPWPFEGPFEGRMTNPDMMIHTIDKVAELKRMPLQTVSDIIYRNTINFYHL